MSGFLYSIKKGDHHLYAIGSTTDPEDTLKIMQKQTTEKLIFKYLKRVDNHEEQKKAIHKIFQNNKTEGDWFKFSSEDIERANGKFHISVKSVNNKIINATCKVCGMHGSVLYEGHEYMFHLIDHSDEYVTHILEKQRQFASLPSNKFRLIRNKMIREMCCKLMDDDAEAVQRVSKFYDDKCRSVTGPDKVEYYNMEEQPPPVFYQYW